MRLPHDGRQTKKRPVKKTGIRLGFVLLTAFLTFCFIVIFASPPVKGDTDVHVKQVAAKEHHKKTGKRENEKKKEKEPEQPNGKIVYLTFDDGPSEWTGQFLDVLKEHGIQATFFMQGIHLKKAHLQKDVKRATEDGHYVGAHSMTHDYQKLYAKGQFVPEMKETLALIHEITGTDPHLVRPPYGSMPGLKDEAVRDQMAEAGIKLWDWTIDSNDWNLRDNPQQIVENIKEATKIDVEVVLMHEQPQTLQALPEIIAFYKEKGYTFGVYRDADHFHCNFLKDDRL